MATEFDVVVIGGGPAGEVAAGRVAAGGLSVALVEHERVGGECSFWACIPSKALLRPAELYDTALHTPGVRAAVRGSLDAAAVLKHRDTMAHNWDDSSQVDWLKGAHVTLLRGTGRLTGPREVAVTDGTGREQQVTARKAVIVATGSRPRIPDIPGLRDARPWTNREGTASKTVPQRLLVLGGGAVALELSQAWKALGSAEVTVVERSPQLLARAEPFVGPAMLEAMKQQGIDVRLSTQVKRVRREGAGEVTATLDSGATITADEILVATGRVVATQELGLERVGLTSGQPIDVDDSLRAVGVRDGWLYAIGDANGRNLLTHMGKYQGRVVGDVILGKSVTAWADHRATPQVLFTQPQVAMVGHTEAAARKLGLQVRAVQYKLEDVAGYSLYGPAWRGLAKLVADENRRTIVGATFVGIEVGELLHSATIAIAGEVPVEKLRHAVPSFPTVSEVWLWMLEELGL